MQALRISIASAENPALSIPQVRALHFLHLRTGANLSATAEFLGLTLPSTSKLVDVLVRRKLLARHSDSADRRRMTLQLTAKGSALLTGAQEAVRRQIAGTFSRFGENELSAIRDTLETLKHCFPAPIGREEDRAGGNEPSPPSPIRADQVASTS